MFFNPKSEIRNLKLKASEMPELPEVQTVIDDLNAAGLKGAVITSARVFWPRSIATPGIRTFYRQIKGRKISTIWRRGKFLVFDFSGGYFMMIHLRMSGRIHLVSGSTERQKHEHVVISFEDGRQLRFHDTRKFGRIYLVKNPDEILGKLGLEPLAPAFTPETLEKKLKAKKRLLKPLLLDQTFIAGLGNIYVDEALWEAKLHPCRIASTLSDAEIKLLHRTIALVLKRGLKNLGTSLGTGKANFYSVARRKGRNNDELRVFRRTGMPCPRCKATIERIIVGQRSTHICMQCQKI